MMWIFFPIWIHSVFMQCLYFISMFFSHRYIFFDILIFAILYEIASALKGKWTSLEIVKRTLKFMETGP